MAYISKVDPTASDGSVHTQGIKKKLGERQASLLKNDHIVKHHFHEMKTFMAGTDGEFFMASDCLRCFINEPTLPMPAALSNAQVEKMLLSMRSHFQASGNLIPAEATAGVAYARQFYSTVFEVCGVAEENAHIRRLSFYEVDPIEGGLAKKRCGDEAFLNSKGETKDETKVKTKEQQALVMTENFRTIMGGLGIHDPRMVVPLFYQFMDQICLKMPTFVETGLPLSIPRFDTFSDKDLVQLPQPGFNTPYCLLQVGRAPSASPRPSPPAPHTSRTRGREGGGWRANLIPSARAHAPVLACPAGVPLHAHEAQLQRRARRHRSHREGQAFHQDLHDRGRQHQGRAAVGLLPPSGHRRHRPDDQHHRHARLR